MQQQIVKLTITIGFISGLVCFVPKNIVSELQFIRRTRYVSWQATDNLYQHRSVDASNVGFGQEGVFMCIYQLNLDSPSISGPNVVRGAPKNDRSCDPKQGKRNVGQLSSVETLLLTYKLSVSSSRDKSEIQNSNYIVHLFLVITVKSVTVHTNFWSTYWPAEINTLGLRARPHFQGPLPKTLQSIWPTGLCPHGAKLFRQVTFSELSVNSPRLIWLPFNIIPLLRLQFVATYILGYQFTKHNLPVSHGTRGYKRIFNLSRITMAESSLRLSKQWPKAAKCWTKIIVAFETRLPRSMWCGLLDVTQEVQPRHTNITT